MERPALHLMMKILKEQLGLKADTMIGIADEAQKAVGFQPPADAGLTRHRVMSPTRHQ
jgi:hypothetical protein